MTNDPILSVTLREEIVSNFEHRLRAQRSPILTVPHARQRILGQARLILDEVVDSYRRLTEGIDPGLTSLRVDIDTNQAIEETHPVDLLQAASVLFETALPVVKRALSGDGQTNAEAALILHRVVMSWAASYAVSHTVLVLKTIRDSHRAQLARLARDLHDRAAHAIGMAMLNLELQDVYASQDMTRAQEKLHRAREAMQQALDSVRQLSAELRTTARPGELKPALMEYLAANVDDNVQTSLVITGDTAMLPQEVCEQVFFALREAIHNALVHSGTTQLDVTVGISDFQLYAQVSDTGEGFSVEEAIHARKGLGLSSMRERVQLLGGQLRLSSAPGHGTTVDISIPLGRVLR
jgi:signal transduction histidine kinase